MRATPLTIYEVEILLRYYYSPDDHPDMDGGSKAWKFARANLVTHGLLQERPREELDGRASLYHITERGKFYVEDGIMRVPLPEASWRIQWPREDYDARAHQAMYP